MRITQMESLLINEVQKVIIDFEEMTEKYDGVIYMMFWKNANSVIPYLLRQKGLVKWGV